MSTTSSQKLNLVRTIDLSGVDAITAHALLHKQWLVTNGLGGYASGTISGTVTWRYHGLLIAALPAPIGRGMMLNHLAESLVSGNEAPVRFGGAEPSEAGEKIEPSYLREFRLENQLPFWRYDVKGIQIEKRLIMPYLQNTVHITFTLLSQHE